MPIRTCIDFINAALLTSSVVGVGQTPLAEDANTAFDLLLEIVDQWNNERFMCWKLSEQIIPSTGAQTYPLTDCPARLDSAYARLLTGQQMATVYNAGPVDFPLYLIDSMEEYNDIGLKQLTTFPAAIWYQRDFPDGTIYPWPIPPAGQFDLHVFWRQALPTYKELTDPLGLPPIYRRALRYEMAALLALNFGLPANPGHAAALSGTKAAIKAANAHVAQAKIPGALVPAMPGQGGISGAVGPHQSVIVLDNGPVLG